MSQTITGFNQFFSFDELTDSDHHKDLVPQNRIDALEFISAGRALSYLLGEIRSELGDDRIDVSSGFRGKLLNKRVGGVDKIVKGKVILSSHRRFEASDIVHSVMSVKNAFNILLKAKKAGRLTKLRKVIIERVGGKEWLHIEVSMAEGDYKGFLVTNDGKNYERVYNELA